MAAFKLAWQKSKFHPFSTQKPPLSSKCCPYFPQSRRFHPTWRNPYPKQRNSQTFLWRSTSIIFKEYCCIKRFGCYLLQKIPFFCVSLGICRLYLYNCDYNFNFWKMLLFLTCKEIQVLKFHIIWFNERWWKPSQILLIFLLDYFPGNIFHTKKTQQFAS